MAGILVWAETRNGELRKSTREAAATALNLGETLGVPVSAVLLGDPGAAVQVGALGIPKLFTLDVEFSSESFTDAIALAVDTAGADTVIISATAMGRDVSARLAAKLNAGLAADVVELKVTPETFNVIRPVYSGKLLAEVELLADKKVLTLRPNVFDAAEPGSGSAETESLVVEDLNIRAKVVQAIAAAEGVMDITEANIIVAGGRGVKSSEGFGIIEDLAKTLGGAVGASRAAVDADWIPYKHQVGQTGKVVSPVLYIAAGISGAIQHFAGMGSSKFIIAINTDPDAPIMSKADFAIVGDLFKVVPILKEELAGTLNQ